MAKKCISSNTGTSYRQLKLFYEIQFFKTKLASYFKNDMRLCGDESLDLATTKTLISNASVE